MTKLSLYLVWAFPLAMTATFVLGVMMRVVSVVFGYGQYGWSEWFVRNI